MKIQLIFIHTQLQKKCKFEKENRKERKKFLYHLPIIIRTISVIRKLILKIGM